MKTTPITASLAACVALLSGCMGADEDITGYYEGDATFTYPDENGQRITEADTDGFFIIEGADGTLLMMLADVGACPVPMTPDGEGKWEISNERCQSDFLGFDASLKIDGALEMQAGEIEMNITATFTIADGPDAAIATGTLIVEGERQ